MMRSEKFNRGELLDRVLYFLLAKGGRGDFPFRGYRSEQSHLRNMQDLAPGRGPHAKLFFIYSMMDMENMKKKLKN